MAAGFFAHTASAANSGVVRLSCDSVRVQPGPDSIGEYSLEFTSLEAGLNNEVAPDLAGTSPYSHWAWLYLRDDIFGDRYPGEATLNIPTGGDDNSDGFADFFDTSQSVNNASSSGTYGLLGIGSGTLQTTWSRPAGSSSGTCVIRLRPNNGFVWKTFTHRFDILEYRGAMPYAVSSSSATGTVALAQVDYPESRLEGLVAFTRSAAKPFDELFLGPGAWTNVYGDALKYSESPIYRDPSWPTNYFGWIEFEDGDPGTTDPDYRIWTLSIDDLNDTNQNGIPDLSDDPAPAQPPKAPTLKVRVSGNTLLLSIESEPGRTCALQETTNLVLGQWATTATFTITNSTQTTSLPLSPGARRFWRAQIR